jgi:cell division protein FtsB
MTKRKWLVFGGVALAALAIGGWVFSVSSKQSERNKKIEEEVSSLETEAEKIRRENETLREKIAYFSSQDFREQEAKRKLGLKREDETMVVIRPGAVYDGSEAVAPVAPAPATSKLSPSSRIGKWWEKFFGERPILIKE